MEKMTVDYQTPQRGGTPNLLAAIFMWISWGMVAGDVIGTGGAVLLNPPYRAAADVALLAAWACAACGVGTGIIGAVLGEGPAWYGAWVNGIALLLIPMFQRG